ncbi:hypothetical protein [Mariniluteicoccus flavus]
MSIFTNTVIDRDLQRQADELRFLGVPPAPARPGWREVLAGLARVDRRPSRRHRRHNPATACAH